MGEVYLCVKGMLTTSEDVGGIDGIDIVYPVDIAADVDICVDTVGIVDVVGIAGMDHRHSPAILHSYKQIIRVVHRCSR